MCFYLTLNLMTDSVRLLKPILQMHTTFLNKLANLIVIYTHSRHGDLKFVKKKNLLVENSLLPSQAELLEPSVRIAYRFPDQY